MQYLVGQQMQNIFELVANHYESHFRGIELSDHINEVSSRSGLDQKSGVNPPSVNSVSSASVDSKVESLSLEVDELSEKSRVLIVYDPALLS